MQQIQDVVLLRFAVSVRQVDESALFDGAPVGGVRLGGIRKLFHPALFGAIDGVEFVGNGPEAGLGEGLFVVRRRAAPPHAAADNCQRQHGDKKQGRRPAGRKAPCDAPDRSPHGADGGERRLDEQGQVELRGLGVVHVKIQHHPRRCDERQQGVAPAPPRRQGDADERRLDDEHGQKRRPAAEDGIADEIDRGDKADAERHRHGEDIGRRCLYFYGSLHISPPALPMAPPACGRRLGRTI